MSKRNIIVIGASAGGFEAIKKITGGLPANLDAAVFIVWHMSPDIKGILPYIINEHQKLYAGTALDKEEIKTKRIYVAPPDHHMLLETERVRVTRGPKENGFRPAVDPMFRSAAYAFGSHVIGIILSGALDDGTAGLWTIKERGGLAIVQDPMDAEVASMPESALREVKVDYCLPVDDMPSLLIKLCNEEIPEKTPSAMEENGNIQKEIRVAAEDKDVTYDVFQNGDLSPYTCPECHGVLSALREGSRTRYRCHTGHAFSADSLLVALTESIEESLWNAIRSIQESVLMLNHIGDHFAEINHPRLAAQYFKKAKEAEERAKKVRNVVSSHEQLSIESMQQESNDVASTI